MPDGVAYDPDRNTLTLSNADLADYGLYINGPGPDFKVEVSGANNLVSISVEAWEDGVFAITGTGSLTINEGRQYPVIGISIDGEYHAVRLSVAETVSLEVYSGSPYKVDDEGEVLTVEPACIYLDYTTSASAGEAIQFAGNAVHDSIEEEHNAAGTDERYNSPSWVVALKADPVSISKAYAVEYSDDVEDDAYTVFYGQDEEGVVYKLEFFGEDVCLAYEINDEEAEELQGSEAEELGESIECYRIVDNTGLEFYYAGKNGDDDRFLVAYDWDKESWVAAYRIVDIPELEDYADGDPIAVFEEEISGSYDDGPEGYTVDTEVEEYPATVSYWIGGESVIQTPKAAGNSPASGNDAGSGAGSGSAVVAAAPAGIADGASATVGGAVYKVTSNAASAVTFQAAPKSKKSVTVPASVTLNGKKYDVAGIAKNAFKGSKAKKVTVKSTKLTKKSVKGCFKGAKKLKTVKVPKAKKKAYKKIFAKKVVGKKVAVK